MNEVKTNQEVIMKEAKVGKESIASKANYPSNRQTFICGGMKGVLTLLIAFVLFGSTFSSCSSCKSRESEPVPPVPEEEADNSSTTSPSAPLVVPPPPPVSPPPPSASSSSKKSKSDVDGEVGGKGAGGDGGEAKAKDKNGNTSTVTFSQQQHDTSPSSPQFSSPPEHTTSPSPYPIYHSDESTGKGKDEGKVEYEEIDGDRNTSTVTFSQQQHDTSPSSPQFSSPPERTTSSSPTDDKCDESGFKTPTSLLTSGPQTFLSNSKSVPSSQSHYYQPSQPYGGQYPNPTSSSLFFSKIPSNISTYYQKAPGDEIFFPSPKEVAAASLAATATVPPTAPAPATSSVAASIATALNKASITPEELVDQIGETLGILGDEVVAATAATSLAATATVPPTAPAPATPSAAASIATALNKASITPEELVDQIGKALGILGDDV
jgi:hypothetical protein